MSRGPDLPPKPCRRCGHDNHGWLSSDFCSAWCSLLNVLLGAVAK